MTVIFEQLIGFFTFILIGYILGKTVIKNTASYSLLSKLLVYVFLPAKTIRTYSSQFSVEYIKTNSKILIGSTAILIVIAVAAYFAAKLFSKDAYFRKVYEYTLVVPNASYMGYAVVELLYGEAALMDMMVFVLPISIYTYTKGYAMLTESSGSIKKLINPALVSVVVGMVLGLTGLELPLAVEGILDNGGACMTPVSMLLTGLTISSFPIKELFSNVGVYVASAARLLVIPIAVFFALKGFGLTALILPAVVTYAMPCGLNTIVFPKLLDKDCKIGASLAVISNSLACVTLPIIMEVFVNSVI